ncbi:hypothetical protein M0802_007417 [Mischocyttarus mexicanus]|nr:hypothetical protein M0802_007417 [Mischocyttarus mexicanus]
MSTEVNISVSETLIKFRIKNVLRKFKFEEFEDAVLPVFPEITWSHLRSELIKQHEQFVTSNVVSILEKIMNDNKLQEKELKKRLMRLELIEITRHKRKCWYTYRISEVNNEPPHIGTIDFKETVKRKLQKLESTMKKINIDAIVFNGVMYLSIKFEVKNNVKTPANYYAIFLDKKYIFSAQKRALQVFLDAITQSMGFNKNKSLDLSGKDLISLMRLIRIRKQGAVSVLDIMNVPTYKTAKPIIRNTGIDFTNGRQRRNFIENRFGANPPTLETLSITGPNTTIVDRQIASRLKKNTIQIGWEFRSENMATFLKNLYERGILLSPLPPYVSNFMSMGRNKLTLEEE